MPKISPESLTLQTFVKAGNRYISPAGTLTLHKRKEYTKLKPEKYLFFYPTGTGEKLYLSSLYPQPNGRFIAEANGVYWSVNVTDDAISFEQVGAGGGSVPPSIVLGERQLQPDATSKTTKP